MEHHWLCSSLWRMRYTTDWQKDSSNQDSRSHQWHRGDRSCSKLLPITSQLLNPFNYLFYLLPPRHPLFSKEQHSPCTAGHYVKALHYRIPFHLQSPSSSGAGWERTTVSKYGNMNLWRMKSVSHILGGISRSAARGTILSYSASSDHTQILYPA